jgi:transposase
LCYLNALSQYYTHQKQAYCAAGSLMTKARDAAVNRALLSALTHAKIGELTLENDFLEGALTKAGLLSAKR